MPWIISFIISWVLFFALADIKKIRRNVWGGIYTLSLGTIVDYGGQVLGLYEFYELIIPFAGCSAFYKLGPVFVMGLLFTQYLPSNKWLQAVNILAFTVYYMLMELCVISVGVAEYIHWSILASIVINLLAFSSLAWLTMAFLRDK